MALDTQEQTRQLALNFVKLGDKNFSVEARGNFRAQDAAGYIPTPESAEIFIDLPQFEGPLDLLLYLIKKHSMDIFDIPIVLIAQKYLEVIDAMEQMNLDIAGEFLVMAAELLHIKSRLLLPKEQVPAEENGEEEQDPRKKLMQRLYEYQRVKEAAAELALLPRLGSDVFFRAEQAQQFLNEILMGEDAQHSELHNSDDDPSPIEPPELFELLALFAKAIKKKEPGQLPMLTFERVNLRARLSELIEFSRMRNSFSFDDAARFFGASKISDLIVTFLAVLEMAKLRLVRIDFSDGATIKLLPNMDSLGDFKNETGLAGVEEV
jgi:segregation and condensation protein A